ncbi:hypothetical protein [Acetobacter malorum]|uniref:hypothetical protein n=1 Tax=Acetobacter malorum TaxID=178901 RepID=UPI0012E7B055|nr:hypothetical protein [Acetobacter malorum]
MPLFVKQQANENVDLMPEWKAIAESGVGSLDLSQIKVLIIDLGDHLSGGDFPGIDRALGSLDFSRMGEDAIVTVSRTLYPARSALPGWQNFLQNAQHEIEKRGLDGRLLCGIVDS